jgi:hypothetical protein
MDDFGRELLNAIENAGRFQPQAPLQPGTQSPPPDDPRRRQS